MTRTKFYVRVDIEHDTPAETSRLSSELARAIKKLYGVREVEISHTTSEQFEPEDDEI